MPIIDCHTCPVRGRHCGDCMVSVVARQWLPEPATGPAASGLRRPAPTRGTEADHEEELQDDEWDAVEVFVRAGMVNTLSAADARVELSSRSWSHAG